ncbi:MAG: hypothetical protein GY895_04105, partial [Phycisphaera sp.]|nr:hypothetical protein [Phycisphaera sp.]
DLVVPDDAGTIQLAIDTATDGDRIAVRPGTYDEGGLSLAGRDLELVGVDDLFLAKPVVTGPIDASGMPETGLIRYLAITGGTGIADLPGFSELAVGGGLVLDDARLLVQECDVFDNSADLGGGVFVRDGAARLESVSVNENSAVMSGGGMFVEGDSSTTLTLDDCLVVANDIPMLAASRGGGVDARGLTDASSLILAGTAISQNLRENLAQNVASGSLTDLGGNSIALANDCDGNDQEDASDIGDFARPDCDGNLVPDDCDIAAGDQEDCNLDGIPDACQIADGSADLNLNGIIDDCEAELVFEVPTTFPTIAAAFASAPDGSVIGLAPGTYTEPIDFAARDLVLRGDLGDPSSVVIDGSSATASVIAFAGNQTANAGLEGLTITGGDFGTPIPGQPSSLAGGGLFVYEASPRFIAVIFRDNVAGFGGGAYVLGGASSFTDCVFIDNFATTDGGGLIVFDTLATFDGARIENNQATNDGGGVKVVRGDSIFAGGEVTGNQATEGGGIYYFADAETDRLQLQGMTITGNTATKSGGGLKARFGNPGFEILDSVVCDNEPDSIDGPYLDLGGNDLCVCPADLNGDGVVGAADLGILLGAWGPCTTDECLGDLNRDGDVDAADLGPLLGSYGACP